MWELKSSHLLFIYHSHVVSSFVALQHNSCCETNSNRRFNHVVFVSNWETSLVFLFCFFFHTNTVPLSLEDDGNGQRESGVFKGQLVGGSVANKREVCRPKHPRSQCSHWSHCQSAVLRLASASYLMWGRSFMFLDAAQLQGYQQGICCFMQTAPAGAREIRLLRSRPWMQILSVMRLSETFLLTVKWEDWHLKLLGSV